MRCLVFDSERKSTELASNSVRTNKTSHLLEYEIEASIFPLQEGELKPEARRDKCRATKKVNFF